MAQQTAMQQLLAQLKDERQNLVMNIEWDRCYQAIEMVIKNTFLQMEKEQIMEANILGMQYVHCDENQWEQYAEQYYNETYGNKS